MSSSTIEKNKPTLLALGDIDSYKSLFNQIKNQFLTKKMYKNSLNQIEFISSSNENSHLLRINTKYYDIDLNVEFISSILDLESSKNHQHLEAIFIILNKNNSHNFHQNESFERLVENNKNKLNILLSDNQLDKETRDDFLNKFDEFVDLNISLDNREIKVEVGNDNDDDEDDQDDYSDLDELINSIFVHSWSKMNLKDEKNQTVSSNKTTNSQDSDRNTSEISDNTVAGSSVENKVDTKKLEDIDSDLNELDFENLIMNLNDIRKKAENLSFDERKKYAENVVMNFWKSIGGNEEEIAGLDDSDQD